MFIDSKKSNDSEADLTRNFHNKYNSYDYSNGSLNKIDWKSNGKNSTENFVFGPWKLDSEKCQSAVGARQRKYNISQQDKNLFRYFSAKRKGKPPLLQMCDESDANHLFDKSSDVRLKHNLFEKEPTVHGGVNMLKNHRNYLNKAKDKLDTITDFLSSKCKGMSGKATLYHMSEMNRNNVVIPNYANSIETKVNNNINKNIYLNLTKKKNVIKKKNIRKKTYEGWDYMNTTTNGELPFKTKKQTEKNVNR